MAISLPIISSFDNTGLNKATKGLSGLRKTLLGFGSVVAGAFAVRQVASFVKESVAGASDLAESINAVQVAFGDASEGVLEFGKNAATSLGVSRAEFNSAAVRFSAFAERIVGEGGDVARFIGDISTRATDFASVFNIDVAEALQVFQSGLAGEAEPLKRFGINLLQSEVQAYALRSGLINVGETMDENTKIQARYGLLMEETNKVAGDFANTSDGLANSQRILQANFRDIRDEIGTALIPAFAAFTTYLLDEVVPPLTAFFRDDFPVMIDNIAKRFGDLRPAFEDTGQILRDAFDIDPDLGFMEGLFDKLGDVIASPEFGTFMEDLVTGFVELLPQLIELVPLMVDFYEALLPIVEAVLPQLTSLLLGVTQATGEGISGFQDFFDALRGIEREDYMGPGMQRLADQTASIIQFFQIMSGMVQLALSDMGAAIQGTWDNIALTFTNAWNTLFGITSEGMNQQQDELTSRGPLLNAIGSGLMTQFHEGILAIWPTIQEWFAGRGEVIQEQFGNALEILLQIGKDIVQGLLDGLKAGWDAVVEWVSEKVQWIKDKFADALDISSPSKVFFGFGQNIVQGLVNGMDSLSPRVDVALDNITPMPSITNTAMPAMRSGGAVYNISVQAGVGDPVRIGQEVVNAITRYERASGVVFARAS